MADSPEDASNQPSELPSKGVSDAAASFAKYLYWATRAAMRGAPPPLKGAILATFALTLVGLLALLVPPYEATKQLYALVISGSFLLLFSILFVVALVRLPRPKVDGVPPTMQVAWRTFLENARAVVQSRLHGLNFSVADADVRANVFLPHKVRLENGVEKVVLRIPPVLCINMEEPKEREITFEPGTGATGHAFRFGEPVVIHRDPKERYGWDRKYKITALQAKIIHPDLKWIISMPIQVDRQMIGVANVDGLRHDFSQNTLIDCSTIASAFVQQMINCRVATHVAV